MALLDKVHEEVSCSVCKCPFTEPKQLPCLHSFCLECLNGIHRTSPRQDAISCPECRKEIRIPGSGNPSEFPTNLRMNSLLNVVAIKECNITGVKCGNCDKTSTNCFYCFQCWAFWCEDCISPHNLIRANKEHRVLAIKDFQDQDIEDVLKRPAFCQITGHENSKAVTGFEGKLVRGSSFEVPIQIRRFIPVLSFGEYGESAGKLHGPSGVAVNNRNEIAVTELGNNRVSVFSSDSVYVRSFGREGLNQGEFLQPSGIAFDNNGNIIVADFVNNSVQLFTGNGEFLTKFGEKGNLDHQLENPKGLSISQ